MDRYEVTIRAEGRPPVTVTVEAADEWKARTRAMLHPDAPRGLRGQGVDFEVRAL